MNPALFFKEKHKLGKKKNRDCVMIFTKLFFKNKQNFILFT